MILNFSSTPFYLPETLQKTEVHTSYANEKSANFSNENNINKIQQKVLVDSYFKMFDNNLSDLAIKNLISERLQPAHLLAHVHNTEKLAQKSKELLDFSLSV